MSTLLIAIASFAGFIIAYNTYGRWLARRIFNLDDSATVPSQQLNDGVDFVPTDRKIVFGHHFTSIAGTGPIVGPAIAVFWGWLPALLWVVFGSIFIGAVHDFSALVISLRNRGQTIGEVAGRLISPRARVLFLLILFFALTVVLAIFGLVIAIIFSAYPESVLPVWISLPIALIVGYLGYKKGVNPLLASLVALVIVYFSVYVGAYHLPITLDVSNQVVGWTIILLVYCFFASVLPVWMLLQPRDYINSQQLIVALLLLVAGLLIVGVTNQADLFESAPAITKTQPAGTPPIWPFLFITIACGAVSGFHCLVSSGTSSKQLKCESDARYVGYGAMLLEGALAVIVILACCAGVGMGKLEKTTIDGVTNWQRASDAATGEAVVGRAAWDAKYTAESWQKFKLPNQVGAFVEGGGNFLYAIGVPLKMGIAIIAVLVACFAATTLDTATRLQRYVVQELAATFRVAPLQNKYGATLFAVLLGGIIAMVPGSSGVSGTGGLLLWPLFGATNQLLAGLAFLVTVFFLWRRNKPIWFAVIPMVIMIIMPAWALIWSMFHADEAWPDMATWTRQMLFGFSLMILGLQIWMIIEAIIAWPKAKGVLEAALPPLPSPKTVGQTGGRN
jgi:carbon starvation protein